MSYRNDHDAALARVDALEAELEKMAGEYEKTREVLDSQKAVARPRSRSGVLAAAFLAMAALGTTMTVVTLRTSREEPQVAVAAAEPSPYDSSALTSDLATCLAGVEASMHSSTKYDADTTDPRGSLARSVQPIIAIGAGCRPALDKAAGNPAYGDGAQALLARWVQREDELAGAISRITVYYGSDPYVLDGYATAGQLWREFDRARESRDALVEAERAELRRVVSY